MHLRALPLVLLCVAGVSVTADADRIVPVGCEAAVYRQFDFWVGEWDVHTERTRVAGKPARSRVRAVSLGCALLEEYSNAWGYSATSLSVFDDTGNQWRQVLVDYTGRTTVLAGYFETGRMVLYDQASKHRRRVTWTPLDDGNVRQHGETSSDGTTWSTSFDALYTPR
jgi:hypothetical protein